MQSDDELCKCPKATEPDHNKTKQVECASSENSDQPAYVRGLINLSLFPVPLMTYIHCTYIVVFMQLTFFDWTVRVIVVFAACICHR